MKKRSGWKKEWRGKKRKKKENRIGFIMWTKWVAGVWRSWGRRHGHLAGLSWPGKFSTRVITASIWKHSRSCWWGTPFRGAIVCRIHCRFIILRREFASEDWWNIETSKRWNVEMVGLLSESRAHVSSRNIDNSVYCYSAGAFISVHFIINSDLLDAIQRLLRSGGAFPDDLQRSLRRRTRSTALSNMSKMNRNVGHWYQQPEECR